MITLPRFSSPLLIRPKSKQLRHMVFVYVLLAAMQAYIIITAISKADAFAIISSILTLSAATYHTVTIYKNAAKDVTSLIYPVILTGIVRVLLLVTGFLLQIPNVGLSAVAALLAESLFWAALVFCVIRAVCGHYKLLVPLALIFVALFYVCIKYNFQQFSETFTHICTLLLIWFPVDAVVFTSLYDEKIHGKRW
ncbi:MAG: hypothetical protein IJC98_02900 [Clostridia bacterium]|nr:hypothetical protein [Clostridia bacterium]